MLGVGVKGLVTAVGAVRQETEQEKEGADPPQTLRGSDTQFGQRR